MRDEYLSKSNRFQALGLIPLQEPPEAVMELRRIVKELGFCGAVFSDDLSMAGARLCAHIVPRR